MADTLTSASAGRTVELGRVLGNLLAPGDVVSLSGDLGAGKTTLIKGIAEGLGLDEPVTSPTFNILVAHPGGRVTLDHFDLYRLERAEQLEDIDFWGVLESGGASVVEWGDRFPEAMPPDVLSVAFAIVGDEERRLTISADGPRSSELSRLWREGAGDAP